MKTIISVASVLACAFSLSAQIKTTIHRLPDGSQEIRIRNHSATSLVAFVVYAKPVTPSGAASHAPHVAYFDAIEPETSPLLASEERVVMTSGFGPAGRDLFEEPVVTAGIFADGTTTGDGPLLTRLLMRRSNMLLAVETALDTLSDAGRRNVPRDRLIEQFKKMADSLRRSYIPPEQQVGSFLYQSIVGKLTNLPDGEVGSPFPPATFVAQETAMLNRQRYTLLDSQPSLVEAALIGR
jgi:hypothetical protein